MISQHNTYTHTLQIPMGWQ